MANEPKQDRSRETHRRLLECTMRMVAERGLQGTTVGMVAEEAGVSRGAAQHHFPTREALMKEAIDKLAHERTTVLSESMAALDAGPGGAPVEDVLRLLFREFSNDLFHAAVHIWAGAAAEESLRDVILPAEATYNRRVYELTAGALHADLSDQHTRRLITMLLDVARGLGLSSMLVDTTAQTERAVAAYSRMLGSIVRLDD